ncbi:HAD family hydrolase [Sphingobacterium sp.]|uniref:HAD family hydrolase n=1 Tax=Sphingobacterium sp. TaxID=341027 RepID=UPI00289B225B|nr:HAD family hydrolase [Sphingobacterium sp.]
MCKIKKFKSQACNGCKGQCPGQFVDRAKKKEAMNTVKAIIFDLDNTVYLVESISESLLKPLFSLIEGDGRFSGDFDDIKSEIKRKPYQFVAEKYHFAPQLTAKGAKLLSGLEYDGPIETFEGFREIERIECTKFLVTAGFTKLQFSKIKKLDLERYFDEIFIVDAQISKESKKDIFSRIISNYNFQKDEVLVLGDDLHSEIKAGKELGLQTMIFDYEQKYPETGEQPVVKNYKQFMEFF